MLTFKDTERQIGKADCINIVIVEDGIVVEASGRPGFKPYFLMRITFDSAGDYMTDNVPTGIYAMPYIESPDEMIITDGADYWVAARHLTPEQLELNHTPEDKDLYLMDADELPERLQNLAQADREYLIRRISIYCREIQGDE